jgi:hypothetical protein
MSSFEVLVKLRPRFLLIIILALLVLLFGVIADRISRRFISSSGAN